MSIKLDSKIPQFLAALQKNVEEEIQQYGEEIFQKTQDKCHVKTGYLQSTGDITHKKMGFVISYTATYAKWVEYKTGFMREAALEMEAEATEVVSTAIVNSISEL
jgi:hypothetical protein